jgi:hypothetical protein
MLEQGKYLESGAVENSGNIKKKQKNCIQSLLKFNYWHHWELLINNIKSFYVRERNKVKLVNPL